MSAPSDTECEAQISVDERASVTLAAATPSSADVHQEEWKVPEPASLDEPSEELSSVWDELLRDRLAWFLVPLLIAMVGIFALKPLWEGALLLKADSNGALANSSVVAQKNGSSSESDPLTNATKT